MHSVVLDWEEQHYFVVFCFVMCSVVETIWYILLESYEVKNVFWFNENQQMLWNRCKLSFSVQLSTLCLLTCFAPGFPASPSEFRGSSDSADKRGKYTKTFSVGKIKSTRFWNAPTLDAFFSFFFKKKNLFDEGDTGKGTLKRIY